MNPFEEAHLAAHGARVTVDLGAIAANWRLIAARAAPAETAAVVKADAYGCGLETVAQALAAAGARTFFVAHLTEALRLRAVLPEPVIYVLNGFAPGSAAIYAQAHLRPVLGSHTEIAEWRVAGGGPAALHIDTGMNRLGLRPDSLEHLPVDFHPALILSHFVAAEDPADPVTARQTATFAALRGRFGHVPASLCNSSGVFLDHAPVHQMVRPGYALYGGNPTPGHANPMRPVVTLEAAVIQVNHVPAGEAVGYNGQWRAARHSRIATLSIGYADGYLRAGGGIGGKPGGFGVIAGVEVPIVGRVSMDLITVDVTDLAEAGIGRGTPVEMIGPVATVDRVGAALGTNGYEILTGLGPRYPRRHVGAA